MPLTRFARCARTSRLASFAAASLLLLGFALQRAARADPPAAAAPDLQVEYVGSDKGFAVSGQSVGVLCVIRNVGSAPLPENAARVRCYPLTGMDFMEGQLWPTLPALAPNQAVAYRWRLALTDDATPLVFSVLITRAEPAQPGAAHAAGPSVAQAAPEVDVSPRVIAAAIPRFASTPHLLGLAGAGVAPQASAAHFSARVGNDRTMINIVAAQDRIPVLVVAGKEANDWKIVATSEPCLQVFSAEDGQHPWWETFRWSDSSGAQSKESATATLQGTVGPNWSAQIVLESRPGTGVLYGKVRLTARKPVRLYGVQLPRLLGVPPGGAPPIRMDGTASILGTGAPAIGDLDRLAAAHTGALTFGITWPASAPLPGWRSTRLAPGDAEHLPILGVQWNGDAHGDLISPGATIELPFRIFLFGPSDTVKDAARFRIP